MGPVLVKNAERMMTAASPLKEGVELVFADGRRGLIPFRDIPGIERPSNLSEIELPNPYALVLRNSKGESIELPWDFARHYCDVSYRPRSTAAAARGRQALGKRIREIRESAKMTQEALASAAGLGRVTLVRIEKGEQSPRYETLVSLARALGRPVQDLLVGES